MSSAASDLIVGPAVVVDDKVMQPEGALLSILEQLEAAGLPVVPLKELPAVESIVHWRQLGLIVLDWELSLGGSDDDDLPMGITVPSTLDDVSRSDLHEFIRALIDQTMAPVFILSNASVDEIRKELADELADIAPILERRLRVYSKSEMQVDLLEKIEDWIASKPALVALKAWNRAYVLAETATFRDFDEASGDWVGAIYEAAKTDGASPEVELREILSRNIVNRVGVIEFPSPVGNAPSTPDGPGLRRVLNRGAVIPDRSLHSSGIGTGDLFVKAGASAPYEEIFVVITPDCELVRNDTLRLTFLTASRSVSAANSKNRVARVKKGSDGHIFSCLLTSEGDEYDIKLGGWDVAKVKPGSRVLWRGHRRIGRLMEPYLSHLQQNFALHVTRKGLPRVPDQFFDN